MLTPSLGTRCAPAGNLFAVAVGRLWWCPPPVAGAASGAASCAVKASLSFNPPLQASATGNSAVTLNAQLVKCSTTAAMRRTTGHVNADLGTVASNTCSAPTPPTFSNVGVRWTPPSKVHGSVLSDSSAGTTTVLSDGRAQVAYTGIVATGSFATSSGTLTMTTRDIAANLAAACSGSGLDAITFGGSATL